MTDILRMQRAVLRSTCSTSEKMVLLAIVDHYSEASPEPWPSVPTLAAHSSLGRTAVLDALAALERDGVIAIRRAHGRPNRYDLSRLASALMPASSANTSPRTSRSEPNPGQPCAGPVREADCFDAPASASDVAPPAKGRGDVRDPEGDRMQTVNEPDLTTASGEAPVRQADWCAPDTSPPTGRDQSACRTGPVHDADWCGTDTTPPAGRDQSACRTGVVRLADPKEPMKEPKKEATAVCAREAAELKLPIAERARLVLDDPRAAKRLQPQYWPETRRIAEGYGRAIGSERPLSELARDSGLRTILVLLAAEYSEQDLEWIVSNVPKQAWWRSGNRVRGLGSLSIEVVSRALGERAAPQRTTSQARSHGANGEDSRIHRNTLLENAEAGRYGAEIRRAALSGVQLKELADDLEQREAAGELRLMRLPGASNPDGFVEPSRDASGSPGVVRVQLGGAGSRATGKASRNARAFGPSLGRGHS
jgi:hypothetical protein